MMTPNETRAVLALIWSSKSSAYLEGYDHAAAGRNANDKYAPFADMEYLRGQTTDDLVEIADMIRRLAANFDNE